MEVPMLALLRFMWRFRGLMALAFLIILGHIWLNRIEDAWSARHETAAMRPEAPTPHTPAAQAYCPGNPAIPFIPAARCGGMTSCDRAYLHSMGVPLACPSPK